MADIPSAPVPVIFHERKHAYPHDHQQHRHDDHHPGTSAKKLPVIPDLRFEYSYLRSVKPFVKVERVTTTRDKKKGGSEGTEDSYEQIEGDREGEHEKGEGKIARVGTGGPSEVITVQWAKVAWVTIRDQVISPLLQGLVWALASYYVRPFSKDLGTRMGSFVHEALPRKEGSVVSWLRGWTKSIGLSGLPNSSTNDTSRTSSK
ncbi:hypothetical protein CPB84DRAFT_1783472 [Gymnopilus junonius]|uniref:Uncharacterized protein n=1 Tax=Gymnopilus junonius TaxID=109634 RepID=A0A9P5TLI2_GYMJU|nr:hypothetical protein CPB84DRAFT_1783472 [Gymnopilus junonius]